jgi:hypothetical protein
MFTSITWAIKTILDGLIASTTLASVYNYDVKTYESFPCATITPIDWEEIFLDTSSNVDNFVIKIRVVDQNRDISWMEARMRLLADNILSELRKKSNCTLWWIIEKIDFSITWGWIDNEQPMRVFEIFCRTQSVNNI